MCTDQTLGLSYQIGFVQLCFYKMDDIFRQMEMYFHAITFFLGLIEMSLNSSVQVMTLCDAGAK